MSLLRVLLVAFIIALIVSIPFVLFFVLYAAHQAIAADPLQAPSSIEVSDVRVFRNLVESGDSLFIFKYDIAYTSDNYPVVPASSSFLFRHYDDDGVTLKNTSIPYNYSFFESNGYGDGVSSFYYSASDNAPTWAAASVINIYGGPAYFSPTQTLSYTLTPSDFTSETTQDANRDEMYAYVLSLADELESNYQDTGIVLSTTSDVGIVLSTYGELYFRSAIPGISSLCPDLFFIQVYVPEQMEVTAYDLSLGENYTARLAGTDWWDGFTKIGEGIGTSAVFASAAIFFVLCVAICVWTVKKEWGIEPGIAVSTLIGIFAAMLIGNVLFTIMMVVSLVAAMGIVYIIILKRA